MLFKEYHLPMIRRGSKTVTRREWADNYTGPNIGTVVAAKSDLLKPDDECGCFIQITGKREEKLGDITDASAQREGDYDSVAEFRDAYEDVYGEESWDDEKVVDVIEFEYVGETKSPDKDGGEQDDGDESDQSDTEVATDGGHPPSTDANTDANTVDSVAIDDHPDLDVEEHHITARDQNMYRIEAFNPQPGDCGFAIYLNRDYAKALEAQTAPRTQHQLEDVLPEKLDGYPTRIQFEGDSLLVSNISVSWEATGLDLVDETSTGDYHYATHNVDTATEATQLIATFARWVSYTHTLLSSDQRGEADE